MSWVLQNHDYCVKTFKRWLRINFIILQHLGNHFWFKCIKLSSRAILSPLRNGKILIFLSLSPRDFFSTFPWSLFIRRARLSNVTPEKNIKYHLIIINDIKIEKHGESDEFNYLNLEQRAMLNIFGSLLLRG